MMLTWLEHQPGKSKEKTEKGEKGREREGRKKKGMHAKASGVMKSKGDGGIIGEVKGTEI